jgi:hypothetical protein
MLPTTPACLLGAFLQGFDEAVRGLAEGETVEMEVSVQMKLYTGKRIDDEGRCFVFSLTLALKFILIFSAVADCTKGNCECYQ